MKPLTQAEVFARCDQNDTTGCWNWRHGRVEAPARLVWESLRGTIPPAEPGKEQHVLHRCDNRLCVNPDHLYLGSVRQNTKDKLDRGRAGRGDAFMGRLSVRFSMDDLRWLAKVGAMVGQDSSWAVRWAINEVRTRGMAPLLKTVTPADARKGGAL